MRTMEWELTRREKYKNGWQRDSKKWLLDKTFTHCNVNTTTTSLRSTFKTTFKLAKDVDSTNDGC